MTEDEQSHAYSKLAHCDTENASKFFPWEKADGENWGNDDTWKYPDQFRFSSKYYTWKYLEELHRGIRNGKWTNDPYFTKIDNLHLIEIVADRMGLTEREREQAKTAYFTVHHKKIRGVRKDVTAVAVCAYIGEKAGLPYHPQKLDDDGDPLAEHYARMFLCRLDEIVSRYGKVQHHLRGKSHQGPDNPYRRNCQSRLAETEEDPFHEYWTEGGISMLDHSPY